MNNNVVNIVSEKDENSTAKATEDVVNTNNEPIYQQGVAVPIAKKKKTSVKDVILFAQNKIFTSKVCSVSLFFLGVAITLLCLAQIVIWVFTIKNTYLNYWDAIKTFDYINIACIVLTTIFAIAFCIHIFRSIISLIKKKHEFRFETVSTLFAFSIFLMFVTNLFSGITLVISHLKCAPLLNTIVVLVFVYAFIRLFSKDFSSRIYPFALGCVAAVIAIVMFNQSVGNFATFSIYGYDFQLSDLNIYRYASYVLEKTDVSDMAYSIESAFFESATVSGVIGIEGKEKIVVILLQFVSIMVSNVLPYAAVSSLGYLMFCLVDRSYIQYYNLQICRKFSVTMLVVSGISLATTIGLHLVCKSANSPLYVQFNYTNIGMTMALCVLMIVVTSLPWKIYNIIYKHHYVMYKKSEGDK